MLDRRLFSFHQERVAILGTGKLLKTPRFRDLGIGFEIILAFWEGLQIFAEGAQLDPRGG